MRLGNVRPIRHTRLSPGNGRLIGRNFRRCRERGRLDRAGRPLAFEHAQVTAGTGRPGRGRGRAAGGDGRLRGGLLAVSVAGRASGESRAAARGERVAGRNRRLDAGAGRRRRVASGAGAVGGVRRRILDRERRLAPGTGRLAAAPGRRRAARQRLKLADPLGQGRERRVVRLAGRGRGWGRVCADRPGRLGLGPARGNRRGRLRERRLVGVRAGRPGPRFVPCSGGGGTARPIQPGVAGVAATAAEGGGERRGRAARMRRGAGLARVIRDGLSAAEGQWCSRGNPQADPDPIEPTLTSRTTPRTLAIQSW